MAQFLSEINQPGIFMNHPFVSIVLCTYNGALYIEEQVHSILNQTYRNIELIVVDDMSTDTTKELVLEMAKNDDRIRFSQNERNLGYNLNFNYACSISKGELIAIADHDDIWVPEKIEILVNVIQRKKETLLVHGISARFSEHKKPSIKSIKLVNFHEGNDPRMLFLYNPISGHNMLFRKELLNIALPFPKDVYYDWWLAIKACCFGNIVHVNQILVWHRVHDSNATGAAKPKTPFYKQAVINLGYFIAIPEMSRDAKNMANHLYNEYKKFPDRKIRIRFFLYVMTHARTLFAHKKRLFPWFSYIKHSMRVTSVKARA